MKRNSVVARSPVERAPDSPRRCAALPRIVLRLMVCLAAAVLMLHSQQPAARDLAVTVGKSLLIDSPQTIERVSMATAEHAEAVVVNPREIVVNGKAAGETSLIVWQQGGGRLIFDLHVRPSDNRLEAIQRQIDREAGENAVTVSMEDQNIFLRGTVENLTLAERAMEIAKAFGKPVNLLHVKVPGAEPQILLRVRFANLDRSMSHELGANFFTLNKNLVSQISTQQFSPIRPDEITDAKASFRITDLLNLMVFKPELNIGATIRALESKRILQVLAEPNLLTTNGKAASFLAGGEFPYPTLGGLGTVVIQFREFGVRITFLPNMTPRGTLRMQVTPEVSSLDFANGLVFQGFTIPGLNTRRVSTEVELEQGQSFAIGGLLDNRITESLSKVPGLGDIPLFGKLFRSRQLNKNNTELLVVVTPEVVRPIPAGQAVPELKLPVEPLKDSLTTAPRTPGIDVTGPVPVTPLKQSIPVEDMIQSEKGKMAQGTGAQTPVQYVPTPNWPWLQPPPTVPPSGTPNPVAKPPGEAGVNPGNGRK
ncbi:MAG: pilus assembly protein N-terminal domain-containing protein [Acidobacteria bacterium]|nr:pilus assembly protein N-terminal domain-containing protein [Acidobacteriota bacterium]